MFCGMDLSIWGGNRPVGVEGLPPPPAPAETINPNGWSLTAAADLAGEFDPEGAPETLSVTRPGFTAGKATTIVTDTLVKMKRLRLPNPDGDTLTARDVALSDWVYAGDTVPGMTNNSTRAYPRPVVEWMTPEWELVTGGSLTLRLFVAHAYCRNGTPAACVEFQVRDGSGATVTALRAALSVHTPALSGIAVPCYEATLDVSALADGELTANAVIYPHVGDVPFDIAADGNPWPAKEYISVQKHWKAAGGAGLRYAFADTAAGPGGAVATTLAGARTTPYPTADAAIAALYAANGNTLSGCVLVLAAGQTHRFARYDNRLIDAHPFRIIGEGSGPTRAIYTLPAGDTGRADQSGKRLRIENLRIVQTTANSNFFNNRAHQAANGAAHQLVMVGCSLEVNGLAPGPFIGNIGKLQMVEVDSDLPGGGASWTSARAAYARLLGCRNIGNNNIISSIGTDNSWVADSSDGAGFNLVSGLAAGDKSANAVGAVFAYNRIETANGTNNFKTDGHRSGPEGVAIVGNLGVIIGAGSSDNIEFYGASPTDREDQRPLENVICMFNTLAGGSTGGPRDNKEGTNYPGTIWWQIFWRGNVCASGGLNGDYDSSGAGGPWTQDGTQIRNWAQRFGCVREYSVFYALPPINIQFGYQFVGGDVHGYRSVYLPNDLSGWPGFAHDASASGDNDHVASDYRIVDDSPGANRIANINRLPGDRLGYNVDLYGTAIPVDGTALPGGVQGLA